MESSNVQTFAQNYNNVIPPIRNHGESGRKAQNDTVSLFHLNITQFREEQSCNREEINFIGQNMFGFCMEDEWGCGCGRWWVDTDKWTWTIQTYSRTLHGYVNPGIKAQVVSLGFGGPCAIILLHEFRGTHNDTIKHIDVFPAMLCCWHAEFLPTWWNV